MTIDPTSSCHTARQKSTTVFDSGPVERGEGGEGRGEGGEGAGKGREGEMSCYGSRRTEKCE